MLPRIAIPLPLSTDPEYVERALPQYERAIRLAGGDPVRIPLGRPIEEITKIVQGCDGVLLPGSAIDVEPSKYGAEKHEKTAPADPKRDVVDRLLLEDAYQKRKPILGICYGMQILNVQRAGSLIQHIPDFLEPAKQKVNHSAGRTLPVAHEVAIDPESRLGHIVGDEKNGLGKTTTIAVNSSHHQAADRPGRGLRVVGRCPDDGIIEAVEGTEEDHFVLAVQWHPERSDDKPSRAIFRALIEAARR
jgi:putative glutamine amidotransferase